ncbi:MAG TPA: DNA repair exonuclease [Rhodopila sp.]|nr:DNA repair exonuclease [Rhodopila sp.]
MKFLHAADIHLDSPLTGLASNDRIPEDVTRHCTRRAFSNLIDLAISEDVAFLIIAGDLYDGDWRDYSTGLFFIREIRRLDRPCYLIRGNHDAKSLITRNLSLPANVHEFSSRTAHTLQVEGHRIALHGRSFPDRAVNEDFSAAYPDPVPDHLNIGILHTSAEDPAGEHDTYAPCRIEALVAKRYDYWALGHIHQRRELYPPGNPWIIFPGNLQGRHARETGGKGATLIEVQDNQIVSVQHRDLDVLRWASVAVDVGGAETMPEITARLRFELAAAEQGADGRPLIARVTLTGATACHAALTADLLAIDAECRAAAAGVSGGLHVEKVRVRTRPLPLAAERDDLATLRDTFLDALDDPEVAKRLVDDFKALDGLLPGGDPNRTRPPLSLEALRSLAPDAWAITETLLGQDTG